MTCFWDGLIASLTNDDFKNVLKINKRPRANEFATLLKKHALVTNDVTWMNKKLKHQEKKENLQRIKELDINKIRQGYDCSACDPFLLLISQLFNVNIIHNYNGVTIKYNYIKPNIKLKKTLKYGSNRGHFWHSKN
jgi:hypothetical protein